MFTETDLIAGVDEVGRGALFGPVMAAVVVVPLSDFPRLLELGVKDSKQLSPKRRRELSELIHTLALDCQIGYATVREIDNLNIFHASLLAMARAVKKLKVPPSLCTVDGQHIIPNLLLKQEAIVRGDERSPVIAAASIVAKVWRDDLISRWASRYPDHDLASHKGYGTAKHLRSIREYGVTPQHRLSFRPCRLG